jgi:large exoprotein involved in heme utilization and adhesion
VSLTLSGNSFVLGYDSINDFGNISLSNRAVVDASGEGGGDVQVRGARLEMKSSGIGANTLGTENGGEVLVRTTEIDLSESSQLGANAVGTGTGTGGNLTIDTGRLLVRDGSQVSVITIGAGKGGSLRITAADSVEVIGSSADGRLSSGLFTQSQGSGDAGDLTIDTQRLLVRDGAQVGAGTFGEGKGGSLRITASDSVEVIGIGIDADGEFPSGLFTSSDEAGGDAGDLTIETGRLLVRDGAQVGADTFGEGNGGSLRITASDSVEVIGTTANSRVGSGLFASSTGSGDAGDLTIDTPRLLVRDGAVISSRTSGEGTAGDIDITARNTLQADNGTIGTSSEQSSGGNITITASNIRLFGNSDITTRVNSGAGDSGDINLKAGSILAFDDSDILAYAENGTGGDITLDTPVFFGESYRRAPRNTDPDTLDHNNRVDVNATGAVEGVITIPDTTFIQNSLTELPENQIDTDSLLASSCIVRRNQPTRGSFTITGTGGLAQRPGDAQMSSYPTVDIETLPSDGTPTNTNPNRPWQKGDPIVEPQGVYRLPNGKVVLSRECP